MKRTQSRSMEPSRARTIVNRTLLLVIYGVIVVFARPPAPFLGVDRTVWWIMGALVLLTSATDVLWSQILGKWPIIGLIVIWGWEWVHGDLTLFSLHFRLIAGILLMGGLWLWLRLRHQSWASGDWMVLGVGLMTLPWGFAGGWIGGTMIAVGGYRLITRMLHLSIAALPLLPFAWMSYVGLSWAWPWIMAHS